MTTLTATFSTSDSTILDNFRLPPRHVKPLQPGDRIRITCRFTDSEQPPALAAIAHVGTHADCQCGANLGVDTDLVCESIDRDLARGRRHGSYTDSDDIVWMWEVE